MSNLINVQSDLFKNGYTILITQDELNTTFPKHITFAVSDISQPPICNMYPTYINLIYPSVIHGNYCVKNFSIYVIMYVAYLELNTSVKIPEISRLTKLHSPNSKVHWFSLSQPS